VAVIGPGLVGGELLDQLRDQCAFLRQQYRLDLRVLAIATSKNVLLSQTGALFSKIIVFSITLCIQSLWIGHDCASTSRSCFKVSFSESGKQLVDAQVSLCPDGERISRRMAVLET
jgi:homoserine dehydrogenase